MRNIILAIGVFVISYTMKAQTMVALDKKAEYVKNNQGKVPEKIYYKDVNKVLDKYVGEWEGTYDNKTFYFKVSKQINIPYEISSNMRSDKLKVQYRILNKKTGKVIQDKFKISSKQLTDGMSSFLTKNSYPLNYYADTKEQIGCGDRGLMLLSYDSNNKLKVHVIPHAAVRVLVEGVPDPCDGVSVDLPFPRSEDKAMTLTKKN